MKGELLVYPHLGLGDALICNAIIRQLAQECASVIVLCKPHNAQTEAFMWRDVVNIEIFSVKDDTEAKAARAAAAEAGYATTGFGFWGEQPFDQKHWDTEFYRQAGIVFQQRWSEFVVHRQPSRELEVPDGEFCLVHEDAERGCLIRRELLPKLPIIEITPKTGNLFDFWGLIEQATELHFMESSPAILADSLPLIKARKKVLHHYCRQSVPPTYQLDWEHIR